MERRNRILLFYPMTLHEQNYRYYHIPYSVLSIASVIDKTRFEVKVIDNNVFKKKNFDDLSLLSDPRLLCVGVSAMIGNQIRDALSFSAAVRKSNPTLPIIWGGALPTILPDLTLSDDCVDIVVRGQGENTFQDLLDSIDRRVPLTNIAGISFKENGITRHNSPTQFTSLNSFPNYRRAYDLINLKDYIKFDEHINSRTVSYHSSQGCPYKCGFCCETSLWNQHWSGISAQKILDDISYLVERYNINGIKFYDSEFFISQRRVISFAQGLITSRIKLKWAASIHPTNFLRLHKHHLELLRDSGLSRLLIGAETAVEAEMELIGKKINRKQILRIAELCSELGIVGCFTFVTGYPASPDTHIVDTIDFARELRKIDTNHECKIHFYAPYPGTPLYDYALKNGFHPPATLEEWSHYDYYYIVTPWVTKLYQQLVREFNESAYPYLLGVPNSTSHKEIE